MADECGDVPLHVASTRDRKGVAKLLLERGADPNMSNDCGHTPLTHAAITGHTDIAKLLLEGGADPIMAFINLSMEELHLIGLSTMETTIWGQTSA